MSRKLRVRFPHSEAVFAWCQIVLGCVIGGAAYPLFLTPNHIAPGGLTGVTTILNYLWGLPVGLTSLLMNNINTKLQPVQSRAEQIFHDYIALVRKNYKQHREVNYYAEQLFITPKYLGKIIKEYSGRKPGDLIRDYVILEAKAMLRTKQYTVNQVADALNFPTSSFFCRYFRQVVGTSPMKF